MDALRKQLDVLMGANRNGDAQEVTRKYFDRDVCRLYLAGLCPHELFQLTKMDKGPCPKVHSLQLRKDKYKKDIDTSENAFAGNLTKHKGTVRGLEFNSLNPNLLASGTEEGDICIWDISKPSEPSHFPPLKTQTLVHVYKMWWTY